MAYPYYGQTGYPNLQNSYQNMQGAYQTNFVRVQNENEARSYPVAPGNSVTFVDEGLPYIYTKTADSSQLGTSHFEKYRLVKEDTTPSQSVSGKEYNFTNYATKDDIKALREELESLKGRLTNEPAHEPKHRKSIPDLYAESHTVLDE